MKRYPRHLGRSFWNVLVGIDQLGNTIVGLVLAFIGVRNEYGEPDETISSVLGRRAAAEKLTAPERALVWLLDKIDRNHAAEAIEPQAAGGLVQPRE